MVEFFSPQVSDRSWFDPSPIVLCAITDKTDHLVQNNNPHTIECPTASVLLIMPAFFGKIL